MAHEIGLLVKKMEEKGRRGRKDY